MIPPPPRSTLFPYTTPSDLCAEAEKGCGEEGRAEGDEEGSGEEGCDEVGREEGSGQEAGREEVGGEEARRQEVHGEEAGREERSEEHTSELQSQSNLVCRLL